MDFCLLPQWANLTHKVLYGIAHFLIVFYFFYWILWVFFFFLIYWLSLDRRFQQWVDESPLLACRVLIQTQPIALESEKYIIVMPLLQKLVTMASFKTFCSKEQFNILMFHFTSDQWNQSYMSWQIMKTRGLTLLGNVAKIEIGESNPLTKYLDS